MGPESSSLISIVEFEDACHYHVRPPELSEAERAALELLKTNLRTSIPSEATGPIEEILAEYLLRAASELSIREHVDAAKPKLLYYMMRDYAGFWELDPVVNDDRIEEISVTRYDKPVRVLHRDFSDQVFMKTNIVYQDEARLQAFIRRLAQLGGTSVSLAQPSLEVTIHGLSDRRVTATLGDEISRPGSTLAIRKQKERPITLMQLASEERAGHRARHHLGRQTSVRAYEEEHSHKTLTVLMAAYFWLLLERTTNVLIAGETNSGKTTLMNAILALANPRSKVVTAEDVLEINLPDHLHWQRLKTRSHRAGISPASGRYEYSLADLLKLSLRFSPTILSLGEMRGEESETLAAAITLGVSTMTTIHAESAERCVQRLTTPPMRFEAGHVRDLTSIATMKKTALPDGRIVRRVVSVDEIRPLDGDGFAVQNVFRYDYPTDSFSPTTPGEVLDRSFRLNEIASAFGWSPARVQSSLTTRAAFMSERVDSRDFSPESLSKMVREFSEGELTGEAQS